MAEQLNPKRHLTPAERADMDKRAKELAAAYKAEQTTVAPAVPAVEPATPAPTPVVTETTPKPVAAATAESAADKKYLQEVAARSGKPEAEIESRKEAIEKIDPKAAHKIAEAHHFLEKQLEEREAALKKAGPLPESDQQSLDTRRKEIDTMPDDKAVSVMRSRMITIQAFEAMEAQAKNNPKALEAIAKDKTRIAGLSDDDLLTTTKETLDYLDKARAGLIKKADEGIAALESGTFKDKDGKPVAKIDDKDALARIKAGSPSEDDTKKYATYIENHKKLTDGKAQLEAADDFGIAQLDKKLGTQARGETPDKDDFWKKIASVAGFIDPKLSALIELLTPMLQRMTSGQQQPAEGQQADGQHAGAPLPIPAMNADQSKKFLHDHVNASTYYVASPADQARHDAIDKMPDAQVRAYAAALNASLATENALKEAIANPDTASVTMDGKKLNGEKVQEQLDKTLAVRTQIEDFSNKEMQTKVLAAATDPTGQTLMRLAATGTTAVEKPKDTTVLGQVSDAAGKASDTVEKALADAGKYLKGLFSGDQKDGTTVAPAPAAAQPDPALAAAASR